MQKQGQYHLGGTRAWVAVGGWSAPPLQPKDLPKFDPSGLGDSATVALFEVLASCCLVLCDSATVGFPFSVHSWLNIPLSILPSTLYALQPTHPTHPHIALKTTSHELRLTKIFKDDPRLSKTISDHNPVPPSKGEKDRQMKLNKDEQTKSQKDRKSES